MIPISKEIVDSVKSTPKSKAGINATKLGVVIKEEVSQCVAKVLARGAEYAA